MALTLPSYLDLAIVGNHGTKESPYHRLWPTCCLDIPRLSADDRLVRFPFNASAGNLYITIGLS